MIILKYKVSDFTETEIKEFSKFVDNVKKVKSPQTCVAHFHVKKYLANILDISISDIKFSYSCHGKPYYEKGPNFSISHSGDFVFIAFCESEIGIDVEVIKKINPKLINKIANQNEIKCFDKNDLDISFLKLWTLKEAYFKYIGTGITDLKSVSSDYIYSNFQVQTFIEEKYILTILKGR